MKEYNFDATKDYFEKIKELGIIYKYVLQSQKPNSRISNHYDLFFKTAFVLQSSKLEVFVESIIEEFIFKLKEAELSYSQLSKSIKYNAVKIHYKRLENNLSFDRFDTFRNTMKEMNKIINESSKIDSSFQIQSSFNQHGSSEITTLFKQINNE